MKVSIVTPVKDGVRYLPDCLTSVARQSYPEIEHVVVDGESHDGTIEMLSNWNSVNFSWFTRFDNSMYEALNFGVKASSGDILGFLNSDDYYHDEHVIRDIVKAFSAGYDGVFGEIVRREQRNNHQTERQVCLGAVRYDTLLLSRHSTFLPQPAFFIRRSLFDRLGGFSLEFRYASDFDFNLSALKLGTIKHVPRAVTVFRRHDGSITASGRIHEERVHVLRKHGYFVWPLVFRGSAFFLLWGIYKFRNFFCLRDFIRRLQYLKKAGD